MIGDPLKAPGGGAGQQQEENPNHGIAACNSSRYRFVCSNLLLYGNLSPFLYQETPLLIFCSQDQRVPLLSLVISPAQDFCFNVLWSFHKTLVIFSQISSSKKKIICDILYVCCCVTCTLCLPGLHKFVKYNMSNPVQPQGSRCGQTLISDEAFCNDSQYTMYIIHHNGIYNYSIHHNGMTSSLTTQKIHC